MLCTSKRCQRIILAPLRGASNHAAGSGGLRFAPTIGYFLNNYFSDRFTFATRRRARSRVYLTGIITRHTSLRIKLARRKECPP